ncbi:MAG: VCBS repeat-containing protein, partial [Candidatus Aenigmarchaeota archaeon]|nr:VCBS repeat-containing protein [Candidatus Aenigmarchaeota archaeon]
ENDVTQFCLDITSGNQRTRAIIGDFDGDGKENDFIVDNSTALVAYFYNGSTWNLNWTTSRVADVLYEAVITDLNDDGKDDVFIALKDNGLFGYYGHNGSLIWSKDVGSNQLSVAVGDFNHDGKKHEFVLTEGYDLFWINSSGDAYQTTGVPACSWLHETFVFDADDDGFEDDVVIADSYCSDKNYIRVFNESKDQLWYYEFVSANYDQIYSIWVSDINDDGSEEIIFSDGDGKNPVVVLNKSGSLLWSYDLDLGPVGGSLTGKTSESIQTGDVNNDGILDIAVGTAGSDLSILQDVKCTAYFNDSTSYNMTWNVTLFKWEMNRTFETPAAYEYNITCEKGGYETSINTSTITVLADTQAPVVNLISPQDNFANSTNNITFTYNVSDNAGIANCSLIINSEVNQTNSTISMNITQYFSLYEVDDGEYNWSVNCTDVNGIENNSETRT